MRNRNLLLIAVSVLLFLVAYFVYNPSQSKSLSELGGGVETEETDDMQKAMEQEFDLTKDPALNIVPRERLVEANRILHDKISSYNSRTAGPVGGISWTERGPNNVGGRSRALLYDATDAGNGYRKVFSGSVGGGIWLTNDITAASPVWTRIDDFMGNLAITTLAQDPSNTQNIYAGTGEGWFNLDFIRGLGIWKSANDGASWSQLASTNNSTFHYVQKIVVTGTGVVLAATRNGGVQRSTDGGNTWTKVLGAGTGGGSNDAAADLEIAANGAIYCSIGIFSTDGIYRSTDGGLNWTKIYTSAADEERIELACAPSNSNIIYALVQDNNAPVQDGLKKVMLTVDATVATPTWNTLTQPAWCDQGTPSTDFTRQQAWYDLIAAVDPADANTVYIGGVDVMKTTDGGTSWTQITAWSLFGGCAPVSIHADIHALVFKPGSSSELLAGNDGGVYRTTDAGISFAQRNNGYNVTQYYACAIHPATTNYFLAGAQDNGTQKFTTAGMNSTTTATGGDGAFCHIDQDDGNIQITSYVYNNYFISTNGGASFSSRSFANTGSFINPTDYDDAVNILYGGNTAGSYFRWNDPATAGTSTDNVTVTNFGGAGIRHVAVSPLTANRVYFGLSNGDIVMVDNANTGTAKTGTLIYNGTGSVSCIVIDPANEDHMLVTYSNYGVTSVFESLNATQASPTWTAVEGNLPDMPVRWAMFDPRNADWAWVATELGVWSTDNLNGGSTDWQPTNTGLANVRVDMLQYRSSDRTVAAATHGRGLFTAVVPSVTTPDISFANGSALAAESTSATSACRSYTDYSVNMIIANAPTGDATVTVNIQSATATQGVDFDYTTNGSFAAPGNSFVFTSGSTTPKPINIRIYDDAEVEPSQNFILNYTISGTTNAQAGTSNQTYSFTINDNDAAPTAGSSNTYTINTVNGTSNTTSPFRSNSQRARLQYLIYASELTAAGVQAGPLNALQFNITTKASTNPFNGFTVSLAATAATDLSTGFLGGLTQVYTGNLATVAGVNTINFGTIFNWDGTSNLLVQTCFDNGAVTSAANDQVDANSAPLGAGITATALVAQNTPGTGCSLAATNISGFRPTMRFIQTILQTSVESTLSSTQSLYLGPNSDVYVYSSTDGELMARIRNLSTHNYGCTQITVDRAGTGSSQFWNNNTSNYLMNKTFRIVPANNNPAGNYEVTVYFTQAEVNGWQAATGQTFSGIQLIKLPSQISNVTPANPEPDGAGTVQVVTPTLGTLGTHSTITHTFTNGFSGFGAGIPGAPGILPVTLLSFTGKLQKENVLLEWVTSSEQNSRGFEIEKSYDGVSFRKIGFVASAGNSSTTRHYKFTDPQRAVEFNYYRLRMVDIDNSAKLSDIVLVKNSSGRQEIFITNNPFTDKLNIRFAKIPNDKLLVSLYDMKGSKVYEAGYAAYNQSTLQINTASRYMARGIYSLRIETGGKTYNLKAVKQ